MNDRLYHQLARTLWSIACFSFALIVDAGGSLWFIVGALGSGAWAISHHRSIRTEDPVDGQG